MDENQQKKSKKKLLNSRTGSILIAILCLLLILLMAFLSIYFSSKKADRDEAELTPFETEITEGGERPGESDGSAAAPAEGDQEFSAVVMEEIDPNEPSSSVEFVPGASQFSYENSAVVSVPDAAEYLNRSISAVVGYGMNLTFGIESSDSASGIFIAPKFEYEFLSPDPITSRHGVYFFIVTCTNGNIQYSSRYSAPYGDLGNEGKTEFFVVGRTYDDLMPAAFRDEANYGALWQSEPGLYPDDGETWKLSIRVIRADDGFLMAIAHADISYDSESNTFSLSALYPADVVSTGELDEITRDAAVTRALAFLAGSDCKLDIGLDFEELARNREFICVERVSRPYYGKLYHVGGEVISASALMRYQLYAVNIPLYGYGFFTVYMAPKEQVESYFASLPAEWTELAVLGYDAKAPFSVYTFNAALRDADREQFNVGG